MNYSEKTLPTVFFRTIPRVCDPAMPVEEKLRVVVRNTGNMFFEYALAKHIRSDVVINESSQLEKLDIGPFRLVMSMSNFLSPHTDLGWLAAKLESSDAENIIMVGAGAQAQAYYENINIPEGTRRLIRLISERSHSIGVRGVYTAELLGQMGITNVEVIGCPSVFAHCTPDFQIVSKPEYPVRCAFHATPVGYFRDKISALVAHGVTHCDAYVAQSEDLLLPGQLSTDSTPEASPFFFHYYNNGQYSPEYLKGWFEKNVRWFFDVDQWVEFLSGFHFVYGTRFHGNVAALLGGTPALNIVLDTRTRELCEYLNLPHIHLHAMDRNPSLGKLYDLADFSLFNATFSRKYDIYREFLKKNNLDVVMPPSGVQASVMEDPVKTRSLSTLLSDGVTCRVNHKMLMQEYLLRLAPDRTQAECEDAERSDPKL